MFNVTLLIFYTRSLYQSHAPPFVVLDHQWLDQFILIQLH